MPFTGDVSAYAFIVGMNRAIERRTSAPDDDVMGMSIRLVKDEGGSTLTLLDAKGKEPLAGCVVKLYQCNPPDPLQIQYAPIQADANGRLNLAWLNIGPEYRLYKAELRGVKYKPVTIRLRPGDVVELCQRTP